MCKFASDLAIYTNGQCLLLCNNAYEIIKTDEIYIPTFYSEWGLVEYLTNNYTYFLISHSCRVTSLMVLLIYLGFAKLK